MPWLYVRITKEGASAEVTSHDFGQILHCAINSDLHLMCTTCDNLHWASIGQFGVVCGGEVPSSQPKTQTGGGS